MSQLTITLMYFGNYDKKIFPIGQVYDEFYEKDNVSLIEIITNL